MIQLLPIADINQDVKEVVNAKQKVFQDTLGQQVVPYLNLTIDTINKVSIAPSTEFSFTGTTQANQLKYNNAIDISSSSLDTKTTAGFYAGNNLSGAPDSSFYFVTIERVNNNGSVHQFITSVANRLYTRTGSGSSWSSWKELRKVGDPAQVFPTGKGLFGFGTSATNTTVSTTNLVSTTGVVSTNIVGVGTARGGLAGSSYGIDKGIFAFGYTLGGAQSMNNLVANTGIVSMEAAYVGTGRYALAACSYGTDKAIFGFGTAIVNTIVTNYSMTNRVANTGVMATDTTTTASTRSAPAACSFGGDRGIFAYGASVSYINTFNLVANTGLLVSDSVGVGTGRRELAACSYGGDKGIFGYGLSMLFLSMTNLVSNSGVISSDTAGVGTVRYALAACGYGGDKGIFGYGYSPSGYSSLTNIVSNTGVVASDTVGIGTARHSLAGVSI